MYTCVNPIYTVYCRYVLTGLDYWKSDLLRYVHLCNPGYTVYCRYVLEGLDHWKLDLLRYVHLCKPYIHCIL